MKKIKALSLFANVGIGECLLKDTKVEVVVANELIEERAKCYKHNYSETTMITGDITESEVFDSVMAEAKEKRVNLIIATPPCQGMSTAGKQEKNDIRNELITYVVKAVKELNPSYVLVENVPEQLITKINVNGEMRLIIDYLRDELGETYQFSNDLKLNAHDFGVPQSRERAIILLTSKKNKNKWEHPLKSNNKVTLENAIGHLPSLDPYIYDVPYEEHINIFPNFEEKKKAGEKVSKWHTPPRHVKRQVHAMTYTPSGKSAFENDEKFMPRKKDGAIVKGYKNTYKRQWWDKPGYTITMYNRTIGSQNNVHPGRKLYSDKNGNDIYSDARVMTIFELMKIMTIPDEWDMPENVSENFVRSVIGEGIPPLLMKKIMEAIPDEI